MAVQHRIRKLESIAGHKTAEIRIAWFVCDGSEPLGYSCNNIKIIREPGETIEALENRCVTTINLSKGDCRTVFDLLREDECR